LIFCSCLSTLWQKSLKLSFSLSYCWGPPLNSVGEGFNIENNGIIDVYGWDLKLDDGFLTGYLMDGNWIETPVTLARMYLQDRGLRLFNQDNVRVPEPSTLLLMAIGIAGIGVTQRKRLN
ncbi:MAG: PEP-CTERM sorting domain-containing protein, partial [Candidatus Thiodiazotropha sp. (ex Cardiolucina cf. quadrata)]|nr:PEP-CTERM sorting domain-containing protein [Candidatus Thiodiazotropha sp. (ex Cardiolucina cf. quadrata)]